MEFGSRDARAWWLARKVRLSRVCGSGQRHRCSIDQGGTAVVLCLEGQQYVYIRQSLGVVRRRHTVLWSLVRVVVRTRCFLMDDGEGEHGMRSGWWRRYTWTDAKLVVCFSFGSLLWVVLSKNIGKANTPVNHKDSFPYSGFGREKSWREVFRTEQLWRLRQRGETGKEKACITLCAGPC